MTLEKKSKISLKQWVTTIRRYEYELPRLYEKLEYLKVRSIGYSSPSFEPKFGGRGSSKDYSIDYWLERIEACEEQINKRKKEIDKFNEFISKLDEKTKDILLKRYYHNIQIKEISKQHEVNPQRVYLLINQIKLKWESIEKFKKNSFEVL